jgi:UDP-glucose:(heptosyl)LPS alpha-1,3-glucosyltransferase
MNPPSSDSVSTGEVTVASLHVVRRYGPVGGMERYVWELTRALALAGHPVTVICERLHAPAPAGIDVHELGEVAPRPRWLALLRFSRRVERWLRDHPQPGVLIHSHERLGVHQLTTFHGPPFATVLERPWRRWLSLRVRMQLWLERRELLGAGVQAVVPNSHLIARQLLRYYPQVRDLLTEPVPPGVAAGPVRPARAVPADGGVIGFVGREWKRKGLDRAAAAVAELRRRRPRAELWVVGPDPAEVEPLFAGWHGGYRLLGWSSDPAVYAQMDLLLHPASAEPYGMVIAEAMAAAVPVVISDRCGIAPEVAPQAGSVLSLEASLSEWIVACEQQLARALPPSGFVRGWQQVAAEQLAVYRRFLPEAKPAP